MAIHTQLPIYKVAYDLLDASVDFVANMPRAFKPVIGGRRVTTATLPGIPAAPRFDKCRRCNRPLTSARSQQIGYGPKCASKAA
jgi:hypothetical protein